MPIGEAMIVFTDRVGGNWRLLQPGLILPRFHKEDLGVLFHDIIATGEFTYKAGMPDDDFPPKEIIHPNYMMLLRVVDDYDFSLGRPRGLEISLVPSEGDLQRWYDNLPSERSVRLPAWLEKDVESFLLGMAPEAKEDLALGLFDAFSVGFMLGLQTIRAGWAAEGGD